MLHVFRKYQRYIFIVITVVIVLSFSFFGTYSAMQNNTYDDPTAFIAVDGTHVTRSELEKMIQFIGTDSIDKRNLGGVWGPNFFNDGVIKNVLLETGTAAILANAFSEDILEDIKTRHEKEKQFKPYMHPQAQFIGAEAVWNYFSPGTKQSLSILQHAQNPLTEKAFDARVKLYMNEQQFPALLLKKMLMMQEQKNSWIEADPSLYYADLSLFGYHTTEDWFGKRFVSLIAEFIINSSVIAEKEGYVVTKEEAYADLLRNATLSFKENQKSPYLNVANFDQYVSEQLRRMQMDKVTAVRLWQKVLLFKRLFQEMGHSVFVAPLAFKQYNAYAKESVKGTLYQLPEEFRFANGRSLHKFEIYLDSISKRKPESLELPTKFNSLDELTKTAPQLIQKRYTLDVASISKKDLQAKVSMKSMWEWEADEGNWKILTEQFPELAIKKVTNKEERFSALESLDKTTRDRVDNYARKAIIEKHPEWVSEALAKNQSKEMNVSIPLKGGKTPFKGIEDRASLFTLLDANHSDTDKSLDAYTQDNENYYRIRVIKTAPAKEIMTYHEADTSGVLDELLDSKLQAYYEKIRSKAPEAYQNKDGSWKPYSDVYDSIADKYFTNLMQSIGNDYVKGMIPKDDNKNMTMSRAASLRFIKHIENAKNSVKDNASDSSFVIANDEDSNSADESATRKPLDEQWKLRKKPYTMVLSSRDSTLDKTATLALKQGELSKIYTPPNGDLYFFYAEETGVEPSDEAVERQVNRMQSLLSNDAHQALTDKLLKKMMKDGNLSLDFMKSNKEQEGETPS